MNIILLHSPNNFYKKSYGPPCLYQTNNQKTVLEKQLLEIHKAFKNPKIDIITDCKTKKIKQYTQGYSNISIQSYDSSKNDLHNLHYSLNKINDKCIIIYGNIIFGHKIFKNFNKTQTEILLSKNYLLELGCIVNQNDIVQNISWSLPPLSWTNIAYFCNKELEMLKTISMPAQPTKNWYIFEGINWIISSNGQINSKLIENKIKILNEPEYIEI